MRTKRNIIVLFITLCLADLTLAYTITLNHARSMAGNTVVVDVNLDDAKDVSTIKFRLNFDPQMLSLSSNPVSTVTGSLGAQFDVHHEEDAGTLTVWMSRSGTGSSTGSLLKISFLINPGAYAGYNSRLVISDLHLCDSYGGELSWKIPPLSGEGRVTAVMSRQADSDGDGLSDYEEEMLDGYSLYTPGNGDTDINNPDTDGDGIDDGWEVQHALHPLSNDALADNDHDGVINRDEYIADTDPWDANSCFHIYTLTNNSCCRIYYSGSPRRIYSLLYKNSLHEEQWHEIVGQTNRPGTDFIDYLIDTNSTTTGFYRVRVGLP